MRALFQCLKCKCKWETQPGPTQCPKCGHLYVKWINYKSLREIWNKQRQKDGEELI
jgi:Zn finger protein HypA/HybF involved in hydrogenase expression